MHIKLNRVFLALVQMSLCLALTPSLSMAEHHQKNSKPAKAPSTSTKETQPNGITKTSPAIKPVTIIKFDAKEVNGAKVWLPKDSTAKAGEPVTLEVHNSLTAPHGFKIDGYVPETTVGAGETKSFTFTPKSKGVLKVTCHLHPAHVGAEITVK